MFKNRKHSRETKDRMRKAAFGRVNSPETRDRISKNHAHSWVGRKHTEDTKRAIGAIHKGKKVSEETRQKLSASAKKSGHSKGAKNPNWKGGVTPEYQRLRTSTEYKLWRKAVFERDDYACVWCGDAKGGNLEADHIKPFSLFPELRFAIDNGRTLCRSCHRKTDTYGNKAKHYPITE